MTIGYHDIKEPASDKTINEIDFLDRYNKYDVSELLPDNDETTPSFIESEQEEPSDAVSSDGGTMDSPWPQQGYNAQHLGRSPYSTEDNPGIEKWRFPAGEGCDGSPSIGPDGTIYFGALDGYLYAVCPNGSLKWQFRAERGVGDFGSHPAVADDGSVYFGTTFGSYIQAVNPDGTDKWKYWVPEIDTSITIDDDGVIYYGHRGNGVDARYPNGTLKWRFSTGDCVQSTPAVDGNGIVYFGAHDDYIYAVYPNGTLKWRYLTGGWVHGSPTIAPDGTIYCGSDDDYVYALHPDGTLKWKTECASGMRCSPSLDKDGNLYFGISDNRLYSLSPNGDIRWSFTIGERDGVWGSTAAVSDDGTVYFGSHIEWGMLGGGEIIALDLDGNLKWRKTLCDSVCRSSPVIGEDGTVYICASNEITDYYTPGYLHAFGPGVVKKIEIEFPNPGYLYIFGKKLLPTPRGNTIIIGDCDVKVNVYSEDELECVEFYIDKECKFTDDEAPYEWRIDQRYSDKLIYPHRLIVRGHYKGGSEWIEDVFFWFVHL